MSDFLDVRTWSILQWVLVVLAAGFIGQFGKSFAQFIIAKVKARRATGRKAATLSIPTGRENFTIETLSVHTESGEMAPEMTSVPTAKGDMPPPLENSYPAIDAGDAKKIVKDKKALKAILKQQKKAAKASK